MSPVLTLEATVTSLAPGGDGVAHVELRGERRAVFLPRTAPGDVVRAAIDDSRRPARGHVLDMVSAGPGRVTPVCRHSARCGGCDWMHLSPEAQGRAHLEQLRAALPPAWRETPIAHRPALDDLAYRTRARLHVRCDRRGVEVGMHQAGTHDPVAVDSCAVLHPAVEKGRRDLAAFLAGSRGKGDVQIALGSGEGTADSARRPVMPVMEVRWTGELAPACFARLEQAVASLQLAGARVFLDGASRPAVVGDPTPWVSGADGKPLRLAAGGFGQASERMNTVLATHVAAEVRSLRSVQVERAVELYAGAGNLSVLLAREVGELVVVESSPLACDAARANFDARGLAARVVEADAESYVWRKSTDLLVLDPPRTGARAVAERLLVRRAPYVVYVSCDPQTLGRDLGLLASAYLPRSIAAFEMFPQTSHLETVVTLERTRGARS